MITDHLETLIRASIRSAVDAGALPDSALDAPVIIEPPRSKLHGDFACTVGLMLAKQVGIPSRDIALHIAEHMPQDPTVERVEVAGPGFLNFHLHPRWLQDVLVRIFTEDERYGKNQTRVGERTLIEFVSANPTGPISVVNGRAAALGDSLANLLQACGAEVAREFYVNDALNSTQLDHLGNSLVARYGQLLGLDWPMPEDGYQGEYVVELAREILEQHGDAFVRMDPNERSRKFRQLAIERMIAQQERDLLAFGVRFDRWFYESSLYSSGEVRAAINEITARGYAYEKDGALWLKSTELVGDDQDRVLVRSNERETYVAADAAYHKNKFDRGFNRLINIWGSDHHGYVLRLKAGIEALGYDSRACEIILTQMVLLTREGEAVKGSKRAGDVIPLADLVEEIGVDAARFYFLLNSYETTATFDLELAKKQSADNPVYYAQYAHARCCAVLRKAEEMGIAPVPIEHVDRDLLVHEKELELLRKLADYPGEVITATNILAPHRLTAFVREIGQALHQFYEECPALKEGVKPDLRDARLAVFGACRIVVRNLLALLGVSAPERM